ncbi:MAG: hypothetical protein LBN34_02285 [Clostridiales Family XIII bacterium]|jgi:hypothetical protein|nr:hypothetical protein [Clostridiales Family XIII bacterium]
MGLVFFLTTVLFLVLWLVERKRCVGLRRELWSRDTAASVQRVATQAPTRSTPAQEDSVDGETTNPFYKGEVSRQTAPSTGPRFASYGKVAARPKVDSRIRNLNIVLYIASFLIVSGAAAIISTSVNPLARLMILIVITAIFYMAGVLIYLLSERLRPAGIAFTSTGIAIIPFLGIALYYFAALPATTSWLLTSAIGLFATVIATCVLKNQVVSFLSFGFILSTVCSLVGTLGLAIVWYFAVLMFISIVCSAITLLKPSLIPDVIKRPIELTGRFVAPATLVASLFAITYAHPPMYSVLFVLITGHFLVEFLKTHLGVYGILIRAFAQISVIIIVLEVCGAEPFAALVPRVYHTLAIAIFATAVLQMACSVVLKRRIPDQILGGQLPWIIAQTLVALISIPVYMLAFGQSVSAAFGYAGGNSIFVVTILVILSAFYTYFSLSTRKIHFACFPLAASVAVVFELCRFVFYPHVLPWKYVMLIFVLLAVLVLVQMCVLALGLSKIREKAGTVLKANIFFTIAFHIYFDCAILIGAMQPFREIALGFSLLAAACSAGLLVYISGLVSDRKTPYFRAFKILTVIATLIYLLFSMSFGDDISRILGSLVALAAAALLYYLSRKIKWAWLDIACGLFISGAVYDFIGWAAYFDSYFSAFITSVITSAICYALYHVNYRVGEKAPFRYRTYFIFALVFLAAASANIEERLIYASPFEKFASATALLACAAIVVLFGRTHRQKIFTEAGVYVSAAAITNYLALMLPYTIRDSVLADGIIVILGTYVFAASCLLVGLKLTKQGQGRTVRLIVAAGILTLGTGMQALSFFGVLSVSYQILFLVEMLALLVIGALQKRQWLMWWGVVGTVISILYFMKSYVWLMLLFLGAVLIAIVVWRLMKVGKK